MILSVISIIFVVITNNKDVENVEKMTFKQNKIFSDIVSARNNESVNINFSECYIFLERYENKKVKSIKAIDSLSQALEISNKNYNDYQVVMDFINNYSIDSADIYIRNTIDSCIIRNNEILEVIKDI